MSAISDRGASRMPMGNGEGRVEGSEEVAVIYSADNALLGH